MSYVYFDQILREKVPDRCSTSALRPGTCPAFVNITRTKEKKKKKKETKIEEKSVRSS